MKLWQKISFVCSLVLLTVVFLCTRTLSNWAREEMISQSSQNNYAQLTELKSSFERLLSGHADAGDGEAVQRALIEYCFSEVAVLGSAISVEGQLLYSRTEAPVTELVPLRLTDNLHVANGGGSDEEKLISATAFRVTNYDGLECCIYLCKDIRPLHARIDKMRSQFALRGLGYTGLGLVLIVWLVKRNMRHLSQLEKAAASIAGGNYGVRTALRSKDELQKLGDSFNSMAEAIECHVSELEDIAERQRLFISAVAHEFKTPLTSILLNADNISNVSMSEEECHRAARSISSQGRRLEALTGKMLSLITLSKGIEIENISVPELLNRTAESLESKLKTAQVTLEIKCGMDNVQGDRELMLSALINLVDNAIKASKPGDIIELTALDGIFTVRDHGCGIAPEALSHVTEPFFMEDKARSRKNGGAGLGLALVKEIVEAHGAKLSIKSERSRGTEVEIHFHGNNTVISG